MDENRERVSRKLEAAKEEVKRKQEDVRILERRLEEMDSKAISKILKEHRITPAELSKKLDAERAENKRLLAQERS